MVSKVYTTLFRGNSFRFLLVYHIIFNISSKTISLHTFVHDYYQNIIKTIVFLAVLLTP